MKVLMINGSPHAKGNASIALHEMEQVFATEGIETEIVQVGNKDIRGCIACHSCFEKGRCVFDDLVNETAPKFEAMKPHLNSRSATASWWQVRFIMHRQMPH